MRYTFCAHDHASDSEAARCPTLEAAFGPIHKPRRRRVLCAIPMCKRRRETGLAYCVTCRNEKQRAAWEAKSKRRPKPV
jgi:hypothetical protein